MARFAELYLDQSLADDPVRASALAYRKWDRALPDVSPAGVERRAAALGALARDLERIDPRQLSLGYAIDHELIRADLARGRFVLERLRPFTWDAAWYPETLSAALFYLALPTDDPHTITLRREALIARLSSVPAFLETARANLKAPPRVMTEAAIAAMPPLIQAIEAELPKLFTGEEEARFELARSAAIAALRQFATFLEGELLARSTSDVRLGPALYAEKLAHVVGSTVSAEVVYRDAERTVEATRWEMYDLAIGLYPELFPGDRQYAELPEDARVDWVVSRVLAKLSEDRPKLEEILQLARDEAQRLDAAARTHGLLAPPATHAALVVERTPPHLENVRAAFFSPPPAFSKDRTLRLWISNGPGRIQGEEVGFLREYNRHALRALTAREAFPGRAAQFAISDASPNRSITRLALASDTMADGWALLAEELTFRSGGPAEDRKARLFTLKSKLRAAAQAMLDIRIHTRGEDEATLDAWALDLLTKTAFQEDAEAVRRLRRAKRTSTQLSRAFVGYREMLALYEAGRARANAKAAPATFVAAMLSYGAIPPHLIRRHLEADGHL